MKFVTATYLPSLASEKEFEEALKDALRELARAGYNYYIGAFYPEIAAPAMEIAYEMGVAGPGKFWFISLTEDIGSYSFSGNLVLEKGVCMG